MDRMRASVVLPSPPPGFEEIYAKYKSYFVRIAMSYVWDRMAAEDIVTDSFVVFWTNRHDLDQRNIRYCSKECVWRRINKKVYRFFRFV